MSELLRPAERAARALKDVATDLQSFTANGELKDRFAAAKWCDLVGLAETLTSETAVKAGSNGRYRIRCPFHDDHRPSLIIYPPGKGWWCPVCGKGGDAVAFVSELQRCSAVAALTIIEQLADVPGVAL